jgi:hypothetical protein
LGLNTLANRRLRLGFAPALKHEKQQDCGKARYNSDHPAGRTLARQPDDRPHARAGFVDPEQLLEPRITSLANRHRAATFGGRRTARAR